MSVDERPTQIRYLRDWDPKRKRLAGTKDTQPRYIADRLCSGDDPFAELVNKPRKPRKKKADEPTPEPETEEPPADG